MKTYNCPTCGAMSRIIYDGNGAPTHIDAIAHDELDYYLEPMPEDMAKEVRMKRGSKRTVAIVGGDSSGSWAPFGEVEIWSMGDMHRRPWFKDADKWFEIHKSKHFTKNEPHWEWLQKEHDFPIFMQEHFEDVPACVPYPLKEGKLFTSSLDYMIAYALQTGIKRIELYGIELSREGEWSYQREGLAYWAGRAEGLGVEIWLPPNSTLLNAPLYGYEITRDEKGKVI